MLYCVIFSLLVIGLTKYINSCSPLLIILQLISIEKKKNLMCKNAFKHKDINIFKVYYIVFVKDWIFFSSETQKKMCLMFRKKPYLSPLLKDGHLWMILELKWRKDSSLCFMQYCSEVEYNDFMWKARSRNQKVLEALP